ncbi:MAG: DMT family transporter [Rhodobacteraceae bacterium]|nr:DMT family transporter [Paracoccaceae bacterium]
MPVIPYMIAAICVGVLVSAQPPLNAILSRALGGAYAATFISVLVALMFSLLVLAVAGKGGLSGAALISVPWWVYLAGVVGALFVGAGVVIAPVTGALLFFVCILTGQLLGAMIMDHYGAFGLIVREVSVLRLAGFALVLAGALMVQLG